MAATYLFAYNVNIDFNAKDNDPINHVFFYFISTPPVIASDPAIYNVTPDSPLMATIELADSFF